MGCRLLSLAAALSLGVLTRRDARVGARCEGKAPAWWPGDAARWWAAEAASRNRTVIAGHVRRRENTKLLSALDRHAVKRINETFTEAEHQALSDVKGERTWHEAILEEFGVGDE